MRRTRVRSSRARAALLVVLALSGASACEKSGVCGKGDLVVELPENHGHDERIPREALVKGAGRYRVAGGSHEHGFALREADIQKLAAGETVVLRSTSMNAHVHELRLTCAR